MESNNTELDNRAELFAQWRKQLYEATQEWSTSEEQDAAQIAESNLIIAYGLLRLEITIRLMTESLGEKIDNINRAVRT